MTKTIIGSGRPISQKQTEHYSSLPHLKCEEPARGPHERTLALFLLSGFLSLIQTDSATITGAYF